MTNKDTNSQDSIQVGNEIIQTNTLGTKMEERFDEKFKPTICNDLKELAKMSSNDRFVKNTQDLKDFINNEIAQSKTDLLNALIERENREKKDIITEHPTTTLEFLEEGQILGFNQAKTDTINHLKSLRDVA